MAYLKDYLGTRTESDGGVGGLSYWKNKLGM